MNARILVAGADESDRAALEAHLRGAGFTGVEFVPSAAAALTRFDADGPDLVVVDLMRSSAEVLALLRTAGAAKPPVPIIVLAPGSAGERIAACLRRGAEDFLLSPLDAAQPLLTVRRIELSLQRRRLRTATARLQVAARSTAAADDTETIRLFGDASSRFVPREFLENLDRRNLTDVKLGDHVQRAMTVLFTDIRDFTALSEGMSPQQNFDFLNSYLAHVTPIIRTNHGFVDKYIGDAIMALFPRSARDALDAGVALQRGVATYNRGRRLAGYDEIGIGIGMHRGDLILGTIGEEERMQTTVIADAVNVASRIEGLTKTFGVQLLASGTVIDDIGPVHSFRLRGLGGVKAKGKTQSVEIYEVYDNDEESLRAHKDKTAEAFAAAMEEFRKGMFLTAGRIFARIAELEPADAPAAYYRDRCSLTAVRNRGPGAWDGAEKIEVK